MLRDILTEVKKKKEFFLFSSKKTFLELFYQSQHKLATSFLYDEAWCMKTYPLSVPSL